MAQRNAALFTSESAEHNTPRDIIEAIRDVFGGVIDLDPATNAAAQAYINARQIWTLEQETRSNTPILEQEWRCDSLWLNPPFTRGTGEINPRTGKEIRERVIEDWVNKWLESVAERRATQAALLVPARTDTLWFVPLFGLPMCFITGRLRFSDATNGAPFPTVIVYAGPNRERFFERFNMFGECGRFTR